MRTRSVVGLVVSGLLVWSAACSSSDSSNGNGTDGGDNSADGSSSDVASGDDGASSDSGNDSSSGDAGTDVADDVFVPAPELVAITPESGALGAGFTLRVDAIGVLPGARVLFGGTALTQVSPPDAGPGDAGDAGDSGPLDAASDAGMITTLYADVPGNLVTTAGSIAVQLENAPGKAASRSGPLYVQIAQSDGGPVVVDFHADNGTAGQTIQILGQNLGGSLMLSDGLGGTTTTASDGGTQNWGDFTALEVATFSLPSGWHTGQITVTGGGGAPFRTRMFTVGSDLSPSGTAAASTFYPGWPVPRAVDNDLSTSWFSANYDCASNPICTRVPTYAVTLAAPKSIHRIAVRGNREYVDGYDIFRGRLEILGPSTFDAGADGGDGGLPDGPVLFTKHVIFQNPLRDVDVAISPPITGSAVRLVSEQDESIEPGFSEIEIFEN